MGVRHSFQRWFVGEPACSEDGPSGDPQPLMRRTATELARMSDAAEALRDHLGAQEHERTEILRLLSALPEPLSSLPRIASQQDRFGEMIGEALVHVKQRDAVVDATLSRIVDGITQQTEVAGLIQQQLDLNLQAANGVAEGTTRLTEAVDDLTNSSRLSADLLAKLLEQAREGAQTRVDGDRAMRRWIVALLAASLLLIVAALVLGSIIVMRRA